MSKLSLTIVLITALTGCQNNQRFNQPYETIADPFCVIYQSALINIEGEEFDSNQVSNKTLDLEMIQALWTANLILAQPKKCSPTLAGRIKRLGLERITIASASRSPYLQARLKNDYKAGYLQSVHLLGLAVDLEMKGTSFDIKSYPNDAMMRFNYETLEMVLNMAGLVFSEPKDRDPNHVELFRYCKKKNPNWDESELLKKNITFIDAMIEICIKEVFVEKKSSEGIDWDGVYRDLLDEKKALLERRAKR